MQPTICADEPHTMSVADASTCSTKTAPASNDFELRRPCADLTIPLANSMPGQFRKFRVIEREPSPPLPPSSPAPSILHQISALKYPMRQVRCAPDMGRMGAPAARGA
jgi:hypothetical protein